MIVTSDAVVLKSMKYRETSKIVTFYTRKFGKLAGIAKGARGPRNKFGASLEPLTEVSLVLYKKENRDLQLISQCDILRPFKFLHTQMEKMAGAMAVTEFLIQLSHHEEENAAVYALLLETFSAMDGAPKNVRNHVLAFELRFASLVGFRPTFDRCSRCGAVPEAGQQQLQVRLDRGGIVCERCAGKGGWVSATTMSLPAARILQRFLTAPLESLSAVEYHDALGNELDETLRSYLRYHFEELRPLKSDVVFRSMTG
jgi:DNA repair protein RecO (recombination protein O)